MFQWQIHLEITGGPDEMEEEWGRIKEESMEELGQFWHSEYYPLHFRSFAASRYGYEQRSPKYRERKRRETGQSRPLVYTGSFKQDSTSWAEIRASEDEATVVMRARVLNLVGRAMSDPSYPNIKQEATAVTSQEADRFAEWLDSVVSGRLNSLGGRGGGRSFGIS